MPKDDLELSSRDVLELSSRDAVAAFFARLGYDTNHRVIQNLGAMNISSDDLKSAIKHIERLASQDAGSFEVYLFELKSVTSANRRGIVRAFRNRPGDYLLVMTDDYTRLDFVLVERYSEPTQVPGKTSTGPLGTKQVGVRPRLLSVDRRNPDKVALRVLRRFTYTESDTYAQYDKLTSAYDVSDWSEPFFNNRALFSDYYLTERLPESSEWKNPAEAALKTRVFRQLRELYADVREDFSGKPEALVRQKLLEPALSWLGFTLQSGKASDSSAVEPDYRLFAPGDATKSLALCLAYTWGRNLDGKDEQRDSQTPDENPGAAVVTLLDRGEADWAIVTNGKLWRLYSAKAHSRATNYYEIDLEETLALPAANLEIAFNYFWLLFRAASFVPTEQQVDGEQRIMCFLDTLLNESEKYAHELGERLKDRVFEEIFPHFARGFITNALRQKLLPPNLDSLTTEERSHLLEPFFGGTLTFLYRLLFLLYAESRDLLPVKEPKGYYEKSLVKLKREIEAKGGNIEDQSPEKLKLAYGDVSTELYDRLQVLFTAVDRGDTDLNLPVYNGGLFITQPDPADPSAEAGIARFLSTHKIPDRALALGLDRMARDLDPKTKALAMIDYKSLGVRQLGSIYEGLLEFKLRVAAEEMAVVKGKKTEEIVSYSEAKQQKLPMLKVGRGKDAPDRTLPKGSVYLENDRRERKATGSYYTPDYIVKYIVENTVGPVLQEKLEGLRSAFREAEQTLQQEKKNYEANKKQGRSGDSPENQVYLKYRDKVNEKFFDLKVLDPAMGSGHFLVEAVDFITDRMADYLNSFPWNPVQFELQKTRRDIQEEMERQDITIDASKLTDLNLLKRRVLKSCIYGVDLNPMAVELAKVSLWLDCFTLGAPLSFLDHHLKAGNSLIGGSVLEVQDALSRDLFGNQFAGLLSATQLMRRVGELSDVTAQEVAESRQTYKGAYDALRPFKRLLDVWISEHFGNKGAQRTASLYAGAIVASDYRKTNPVDTKAIETALALSETKRFFHWELEFPEVFFNETERKQDGGFDAVVGNPPWVDVQELLEADKIFFKTAFKTAIGKFDLYSLFVEHNLKLTGKKGITGCIIQSKFVRTAYGEPLRAYLAKNSQPRVFIDLADAPAFPHTTTYPLVLITSSNVISNNALSISFSSRVSERELAQAFSENFSSTSTKNYSFALVDTKRFQTAEQWSFMEANPSDLDRHFRTEFCYLFGDVCVSVSKGIVTCLRDAYLQNQKFFLERDIESELVVPIVTGADVARYDFDDTVNFALFPYTKQGYGREILLDLAKYPKANSYFSLIRKSLEERRFFGKTIKEAKLVYYSIPHVSGFSRDPKIIFAKIAKTSSFTYDLIGNVLCYETCFFATLKDPKQIPYLTTLLNSRLLFYVLSQKTTILSGGFLEYKGKYIEALPIRRIVFTTPEAERVRLVEKLNGLYGVGELAKVLVEVSSWLPLTPEGAPDTSHEKSDVVHDLLAYLAEEMLRLNKEKRAAQKEFLDWLIVTLKVQQDKDGKTGLDALMGKAKLSDFPGDYQKGEPHLRPEELMDILQKNKSKLGVRLTDTALVEGIQRRYTAALEKALPLKERLSATDKLIDQIVYKLYGLTEDEIKIVEGQG